MLKITATGNLTNEVELKLNENTGKPYAILRIASDRRYHARDGRIITDFVSVKVGGKLAQRCAAYAVKGCKLTACGDFETIVYDEESSRRPGFLIKATDVEFLTPGRAQEGAAALSPEEDEPAVQAAA